MLHVRIIDGVPAYVGKIALEFAAPAEQVLRVDHAILIDVVPAQKLTDPRGKLAVGIFYFDRHGEPTISLAGDLRKSVERWGQDRALGEFVHTFAHELAHYEQWRDGRIVQERGVEVRARNIVKLCEAIR